MTRITKELRNEILDNALAKTDLQERRDALEERRAEWTEKVRIHALGGPEAWSEIKALRDRLAKKYHLDPRGLLNRNTCIRVNVAGNAHLAYFYDGNHSNDHRVTVGRCTLQADDPLAQEWRDIEAESDQIEADEQEVKHTVLATLGSFTTVKKLVDAWPEAVELLPERALEPSKPPAPPALRTEVLNGMLGLPTEATK